MELSTLSYFLIISVALTLAPGPDILFVIAQSISQGKKAGISTALGLCSGLIFHTLAAILGFSVIVYQSAIGFKVIKYFGAAYLIYLAFMALREKDFSASKLENKKLGLFSLYKKGIIMNILNPKVSLFFLAFFPQFISEKSGNIQVQMIILGIAFIIQAIIVFSIVSYFSEIMSNRLKKNSYFNSVIKYVKAGIFGFIGIKLALAEK